MDFLRFPRTPHLLWLGTGAPRDDKVLPRGDAELMLSHSVVVEEKVDGANLGISFDVSGLRVQNRGSFLVWDELPPQFRPLPRWVEAHRDVLTEFLEARELTLFGEWCYAQHSIHYTSLPDWFLAFDVYDRSAGKFWSAERRDTLMKKMRLATVPQVATGSFDTTTIQALLGPSAFANGPAEGVYVRWDLGAFLEQRAKLVRPEFLQAIGAHWSDATIRPNTIKEGSFDRSRRYEVNKTRNGRRSGGPLADRRVD